MGRPPAGTGIEMDRFITIWIEAYKTGKNQSDVSRILGVTPAAVSTKAKKFREMGIELPELQRSSSVNTVNVSAAKQLVSRLMSDVNEDNDRQINEVENQNFDGGDFL